MVDGRTISFLILDCEKFKDLFANDCADCVLLSQYMGLWFQQDKLQASWEAPGRCWKTLYSRDRKNGQFKMKMIFSSTM